MLADGNPRRTKFFHLNLDQFCLHKSDYILKDKKNMKHFRKRKHIYVITSNYRQKYN